MKLKKEDYSTFSITELTFPGVNFKLNDIFLELEIYR